MKRTIFQYLLSLLLKKNCNATGQAPFDEWKIALIFIIIFVVLAIIFILLAIFYRPLRDKIFPHNYEKTMAEERKDEELRMVQSKMDSLKTEIDDLKSQHDKVLNLLKE